MGHNLIYLSVDVEADGPIPAANSMLSLGAAAFDIDLNLLGTFARNLLPVDGAAPDPDTKARFWDKHPDAWAATQTDRAEPGAAMRDYRAFLDALPGKPVFLGYPGAYDFLWHHWYLVRFTGSDPCEHRALCARSYASAALKLPFTESSKARFPAAWFSPLPHTHVALGDAIGQGVMAINMIRATLGLAVRSLDSTTVAGLLGRLEATPA